MNKEQNTLPGPVFEAGPGWGEIIGRWIRNNWATKIFPALAVLILLAGIAKVYSQPKEELSQKKENYAPPSEEAITVSVNKGDGIIAVTRRVLQEYLKEFPEISLKPEEKLHVENFFQVKFKGTSLTVGREIKFLKADLQQAVNEALKLTEGQRQKLRAYLK